MREDRGADVSGNRLQPNIHAQQIRTQHTVGRWPHHPPVLATCAHQLCAASQALRVFALRAHVRSHILQGDSAVSFVLRGRSRFLRQRHEEEWVPVARQLEVRTVPNAQGKRHLYETK